MKKKFISISILWSLFLYFCVVFVSLQFNALLWPIPFRCLFILFGPLISIIILLCMWYDS